MACTSVSRTLLARMPKGLTGSSYSHLVNSSPHPRLLSPRTLGLPFHHAPIMDFRCFSTTSQGRSEPSLEELEVVLGPLSREPLVPELKPIMVVISGPSGVGKDSVVARLKEVRPDLYFVVTATSRPMRPNEVEGKDYFFVSKEKFEQWIASNQLLEHALVYGDYKGIPRGQVDQALDNGTDVVLRIDVQGTKTVKELVPDAVTIFITAESQAKLVTRLVGRKTEPLDKLLVRIQTAQAETSCIPNFDYVVVNRDGHLDDCVREISAIIDAEKARVDRRLRS